MIYLAAPAAAWVVAQTLKHLARLAGRNRRIFSDRSNRMLLLSGGMPSAHSATVSALAVSIGLGEGWLSSVFALAFLLASIVMYDAVMVRRSSGQQGVLLNSLLDEQKSKLRPVVVAHGHTLWEVIAGAVVGVTISYVVFITTH